MNFNKRCISKEGFKKHEDSDVAYSLYVRDNLKPNDYFRTFAGQIFKSMNVSPIKGNKIYYANGDYTQVDILAVTNFSDKLIDLIEEGDYVNRRLYHDNLIWIENYGWIGFDELEEKDIKSIVTKEQMESMAYEVE